MAGQRGNDPMVIHVRTQQTCSDSSVSLCYQKYGSSFPPFFRRQLSKEGLMSCSRDEDQEETFLLFLFFQKSRCHTLG
jgi:hypothetical protein